MQYNNTVSITEAKRKIQINYNEIIVRFRSQKVAEL